MRSRVSTRLRVLMILDELGGPGRSMVALACALIDRGHEVTVAAMSPFDPADSGLPPEVAVSVPAEADGAGASERAAAMRWLRRVAARTAPDVLHAHGAAASCAAASVAGRRALVVSGRLAAGAGDDRCPHRGGSGETWATADAAVAPTHGAAARMAQSGVCDPSKVHVIPPAANAAVWPRGVQRRTSRAGRIAGVIADLIPGAGVDVFLNSAAGVAAALPDVTFLVLGDGPERERLEQLAADLGIRERVGFLHDRADDSLILSRLAVLCLPAATDATPDAALSAMVAGTPIVAADAPEAIEIVGSGLEALLVASGDAEALASATCRVLDRQMLARRLAWAARRRLRRCFSAPRIASTYEELYRSCLEAPATEIGGTAEPLPLPASA